MHPPRRRGLGSTSNIEIPDEHGQLHGRPVLATNALHAQAAAVLHVAFHGHMSEYRFWGWEIFVQPLAAAVVSFAVMQAMHISLQCNWRTFDPSQCVIVSPKGPVHLLGGLSQLRF
eukprot:TRINITY_DN38869_c0_g1_i1.p3 TRINITY_DN38869_c0_g1~~TRINITY_DN38869_c0_g1_i1.p3  ORF type:complete len:116 (-),score=14.69 TRINITY_DN38869_c0_g1_i1:181-528(-)